MGHHYVPIAHQKRFHIAGNPDLVWMYDKKHGKFKSGNPKVFAQERSYYPDEVEVSLANDVEGPANTAINKLLRKESLGDEERRQLSQYLFTMATRGPREREKSKQVLPQIIDDECAKFRDVIMEGDDRYGWSQDLRDSKLFELESTKTKLHVDPLSKLNELVNTPFCSENTVSLVDNMKWHILRAPSDKFFVTCDTPAHFFECHGVGTPLSEFTFPISKEIALVGERQNNRGLSYDGVTTPQIAKEINRRVLSHAKRFVFTPKDQDWIATVTNKTDPYLSRILW